MHSIQPYQVANINNGTAATGECRSEIYVIFYWGVNVKKLASIGHRVFLVAFSNSLVSLLVGNWMKMNAFFISVTWSAFLLPPTRRYVTRRIDSIFINTLDDNSDSLFFTYDYIVYYTFSSVISAMLSNNLLVFYVLIWPRNTIYPLCSFLREKGEILQS